VEEAEYTELWKELQATGELGIGCRGVRGGVDEQPRVE